VQEKPSLVLVKYWEGMGSDCLVEGVGRECSKQLLSTFNIISAGILCRLDKARSPSEEVRNRNGLSQCQYQCDRGYKTLH
jgi:hypothetical protein